MRIQYISDVHFEFHEDDGEAFTASLDPTNVDVLVIAGDLAVGEGIGRALDRLCPRFARASVVYVHGNHEYYNTTREAVVAVTRAAMARHENLHWLDGDVVTIGGQRFLGAPLWFRRSKEAEIWKLHLNDFHRIRAFESWVYEENARAIAFLERETREGDVVITHHLPANDCVSPQWRGNYLNPFFVCDVENVIREQRPALWIHGHTHDTIDVTVGATRIVCNPFGYVRVEENRTFDYGAIIDLPRPAGPGVVGKGG